MGGFVRRERRPMWVALATLLFAGIVVSMFLGARSRSNAVAEATQDAELTAQTELAPLLLPRDLMAPIVGERAEQLTAQIDDKIMKTTEVGRVRIYSSLGRVLYSADPKMVGTRPSFLRDLTFQVVNGDAQTKVHSGLLQTYVPIWLTPEGTVVVAEMSQAYGPIVSQATRTWNAVAFVCGVLMLGAIGMIVITTRARPSVREVEVFTAAELTNRPKSRAVVTDMPIYEHPGFRAIEEQRQSAEARARVAEENYQSVRQQLKTTLAQMKDLEGRLSMQESATTTNDGETQALRDQLRETSERLHKAELDNNQLRERMALRQRELEQARHDIQTIRADASEVEEVKQRLVAAERRAAELSRETERLENELDFTKSKFHMTKLSEALREFEQDGDVEIDVDEDDLFEHPVIIRNQGKRSEAKVR